MKKFKKLLTLCLALMMVLTCVPLPLPQKRMTA